MKENKKLLYSMSWKELEEYFSKKDTVILPVGSNEQHGPQNPVGTDFLIAEAIAERLSEVTGIISLRAIPYGVSFHHMDFPGTITIDEEVFIKYVFEVIRSLKKWGTKKILIINGHGGNLNSLLILSRKAREELNVLVFIFQWWTLNEIKKYFKDEELGHAGACETSLIYYIHPEWINEEEVCDEKTKEILEGVNWFSYTKEFSRSGVFGVASTFSKERGKITFEIVVNYLAKLIKEIEKIKV